MFFIHTNSPTRQEESFELRFRAYIEEPRGDCLLEYIPIAFQDASRFDAEKYEEFVKVILNDPNDISDSHFREIQLIIHGCTLFDDDE